MGLFNMYILHSFISGKFCSVIFLNINSVLLFSFPFQRLWLYLCYSHFVYLPCALLHLWVFYLFSYLIFILLVIFLTFFNSLQLRNISVFLLFCSWVQSTRFIASRVLFLFWFKVVIYFSIYNFLLLYFSTLKKSFVSQDVLNHIFCYVMVILTRFIQFLLFIL